MCEEKICPRCGSKMEKTSSSLDFPLISSATAYIPESIKPDQAIIEIWECPNCGVIL